MGNSCFFLTQSSQRRHGEYYFFILDNIVLQAANIQIFFISPGVLCTFAASVLKSRPIPLINPLTIYSTH